jgi:hypothetical protein
MLQGAAERCAPLTGTRSVPGAGGLFGGYVAADWASSSFPLTLSEYKYPKTILPNEVS